MRIPISAILTCVVCLFLALAGCATTEEEATPPQQMPQDDGAGESAESAAEPAAEAEQEPAEPTGPEAAFMDSDGRNLDDGASITLPTGAPPHGRVYLWSSDPTAVAYVTRDGSIPTEGNYWVGEFPADGSRPLSSSVETARVYRLIVVAEDGQSPVVTLRVNWQHEESPALDPPEFVVDDEPVGRSATLPVGGRDATEGRLRIRSSYLGATIFVTNDGSDPSPENYWRTGLSDGFYVFATDEFSTTYKAVATLRGSMSPIATTEITWTASE